MNSNSSIRHRSRNVSKSNGGFYVLRSDVDELHISGDNMIFRAKNELFYFCYDFVNKELDIVPFIFNSIGLMDETYHNKRYTKFHAPFNWSSDCSVLDPLHLSDSETGSSNLVFTKHFVYHRSGSFHYIMFSTETIYVDCTYFKTELEFSPEDIYIDHESGSVYIQVDSRAYTYDMKAHGLVRVWDDNNNITSTKIIYNQGETGVSICVSDGSNIWYIYGDDPDCINNMGSDPHSSDNSLGLMEVPPSSIISSIIDFESFDDFPMYIVSSPEATRYRTTPESIVINIGDLPINNWVQTTEGIIILDSGTLYYYCPFELNEETYNTMEVDKIKLNNGGTMYIYMFKDMPHPIESLNASESIITIKSSDKYYYIILHAGDFKVGKFTELSLEEISVVTPTVNKSLVMRQKKTYDDSIVHEFNISPNVDKFDRFLIICDLTKGNADFDIQYSSKTQVNAIGNGARREFMEQSLDTFTSKYLVCDRSYPKFNLEEISKLSSEEHFNLGIMFHYVLSTNKNPIMFRLPINLLEAIASRTITLAELEFFANIQDKEVYAQLLPFKSDIEAFKALDCGFDTYEEKLREMCNYELNNEKLTSICKDIADGFKFYMRTPNIDIMNIPTLDYYVSGDFTIDRDKLISLIHIDGSGFPPFYKIIADIIKDLPEQKLIILLRNWSASSVVDRKQRYNITVEDVKTPTSEKYYPPDIHFQTCSFRMFINKKLVDDTTMYPILMEFLVTPMNSMRDIFLQD